ncbi:Putative exported protein [Microbacterium esteraromaticum]|uniref:Putative exported protein n=1 Tax=Microbacterium esteraromaticum TaxID=57043 RepID=A0A1R4KQK0_9MICO|nr:hypothetical protein [Microbacterium esteraromaticum]SJN46548.1 Putative exported protein [Microbacterium esteraromaticum]
MPRQSAAVYRRRRLVVFLLILALIAAIGTGTWLAIAQPWSPGPTPTKTSEADADPVDPSGTPTPDATESADPTPTGSASPNPSETPGIVACEAPDIEVTPVTDADTYAAGVLPKLSISLLNKGSQDCTINVGSSKQKFTVTSGSDIWWQSTDCQTEPSDMIVTLTAGKSVSSSAPVVWDRTRSSVDTCDEKNRPRAPGGGSSYHVAVSIGGFESTASKQIILR